MMIPRPWIGKTWVRITLCALLFCAARPNLVLCVEPNGSVMVESGSCAFADPFDSASGASCVFNPLDETCDSCVDVPITMFALRAGSLSAAAQAPIQGTSYAALTPFTIPLSFVCPRVPLYSAEKANEPLICPIRSTVLLI